MKQVVHTDAPLTTNQFIWIRDLAKTRDWSLAPVAISMPLKKVIRAATPNQSNVTRQVASNVITYLLDAKKPVTASTTPSGWNELAQILATLPVSKYAVWSSVGEYWVFVEVREQKSTGKRYLNKLLGAPGHWAWANGLSITWMLSMAKTLAKNPTAHALNYCEQFTRCSACDSPLSNAKSIAEAMGPVCRKKFNWSTL